MKQYIKDGIIKTRNNIVLRVNRVIEDKDGTHKEVTLQVFNPSEEMILADGWVEYIPPVVEHKKSRMQVVQELVTKQWNERTDISNEEALDYMTIIYPWESYLDKELREGMIVVYEDKPWRVRQTHLVLSLYPPSLDTASLYEVIEKEHAGTEDDPIPYSVPMEIFEGKYYVEEGVNYFCTRSSGTALSHNLRDLVGIYVKQL